PFSVRTAAGEPLNLPSPILSPGEGLDLMVIYEPTELRPIRNTIIFEFDTDERASLQVSGESTPAGRLECTPSTFDLENVPRGQVIRTPIECEAVGGPYVLADIDFTPDSSPAFRLNSRPAALDANNRLQLEVFFVSDSVPSPHRAVLEIRAEHGAVTQITGRAQMVPPDPASTTISLSLEWNTARTDFDLHLVRQGGALFVEPDDCYWGFKDPNWGLLSERLDDPFLDTDDRDGFGPEVINLSLPAESRYDVYVQYHGFTGPLAPATTAVLSIGLNGQPPLTHQRALNECGVMWHAGWINVVDNEASFVLANTVTDTFRTPATSKCQ
ncbi:MAG: hypothetical protein AAF449_17900, partial [Myxococcota bacterium]